MKKTNLLLILMISSTLLAGCGMRGPLFRVPGEHSHHKQSSLNLIDERHTVIENS